MSAPWTVTYGSGPDPEDETAALAAMRAADVARLEALQDMAEAFAGWLHQKGAETMAQSAPQGSGEQKSENQKSGDPAADRLRQLSNSFNRAARAVRQIMVLKHEVAGLRAVAGVRAAPAGDGPQGGRGAASRSGTGARRPWDRRDYNDDDAKRSREGEARVQAYFDLLHEAIQIDIAAAGPEIIEEARRESIATKLTTIAAKIPHPALDACVLDYQMEELWQLFAPRYGGPAPPPRPKPPPAPA